MYYIFLLSSIFFAFCVNIILTYNKERLWNRWFSSLKKSALSKNWTDVHFCNKSKCFKSDICPNVHSDLWSVFSLTERTVSGYYHILKLLNYNHMYKLISYVSKTLWKLNLIRHLNQLVIQVRLNSRKRFNTADQEKIVIKHSDIKMIVLLSIQTAFKGLQFRSYFTYSFAEIIIRSIFLMLLALTKRKYKGSLNLV